MKNFRIKKWKISLIGLAVSLLVLPSCNESFLDTQPLDRILSESTWKDAKLSEAFIFSIYSYLGKGGFEEQALAAYTDEAMFTHAGRNINTFTEGSETPTNLAWKSDTYEWSKMYSAIRQANLAIQNLATADFGDDTFKDQLLGEAHFLRAYYYHQLMRFYGGVPLIDKPYGLNEDYSIARNTFAETIDFIVKDLDLAVTKLKGKTLAKGRCNALAALALKGRVLLYAASDLHEASKAPANYNGVLHAYPAGSQATRWQAALAANVEAVIAGQALAYKGLLTGPVSAEEGIANYIALSMGGQSAVADAAAASELIFERTVTGDYVPDTQWPLGGTNNGVNNGPNGYHNWAGNTPIQQLVDDYEMMDGSRFDWNNPVHAAAPYKNRDPRFYATVLYDGAGWKPRPSDVVGYDGVNQIQTGYYANGSGGYINGVDTRESPIENWNGSRTHYYVRKYIDPNPASVDNTTNFQKVPWPFIRYTEVLLNYVECLIETGNEAPAKSVLSQIRYRVGMPAVTDAGAALKARYRNERRIELAYEEHRYHDARRWMIASTTLGRGIKAINIKANLKAGKTPHSPYRHDETVYTYVYTVENNTENETRKWVDKMYYRPIGISEIQRNNKLVQNPGY
ncbi:MAG: hypothetical protein RIR51_801 [Bacteroidota bacterium]